MIEIIYDKNQTEEKNDQSKEYKLPKNIRQIGNTPDGKKIYIEDYVMTFLRGIAKPENTSVRGAILLGEYVRYGNEELIFISGAVEAQNLEFDVREIKFTDSVWSRIYDDINKYFIKLSVVGWFLSRMGFSVEINDTISRLHKEYFRGKDKVLFMMDSLEGEDAFYSYENGKIEKQKGYYIYYVRNESMQNYIISRNNENGMEETGEIIKKDRALVENFRALNKRSQKEPPKHYFLYAATSFAAVVALSVGIALGGNYTSMEKIKSKISSVISKDSGEMEVFAESTHNDIDIENVYEKSENTEVKVTEAEKNEMSEDKTTETEKNEMTEDEVKETLAHQEDDKRWYTVVEGDTLMSISIQMYDSPSYVENIIEANDMDMDEPIYVGEKIVIPYIE